MMEAMSERTFRSWIQFHEVYPFGEDVADGRAARQMALTAAAAGGKGKAIDPRTHMLDAYNSRTAGNGGELTVSQKIRASLGLQST